MAQGNGIEQLFTVKEAAALQGLKPITMRKMIERGDIAIIRPTPSGWAVRIPSSELARMQVEGLTPRKQ